MFWIFIIVRIFSTIIILTEINHSIWSINNGWNEKKFSICDRCKETATTSWRPWERIDWTETCEPATDSYFIRTHKSNKLKCSRNSFQLIQTRLKTKDFESSYESWTMTHGRWPLILIQSHFWSYGIEVTVIL